jgi:hypothetical protein
MTMTKQSNSYTNNFLSIVHYYKNELTARGRILKLDHLSAVLGLSGSVYLATGNCLIAQVFFCLANPILAFSAWKARSKASVLLFSAYEVTAAYGVLKCLGAV